MAKAPLPGTVKTRLVPPLTAEQAADLYRALLLDQLEHLRQVGGAERFVFYAPADAEQCLCDLGGADYAYRAQNDGDLGARMAQIFADLWRLGHRNIVLVGSDLPALPLEILREAFTSLSTAEHRVVIGPSRDGGYYLIGMNQATPEIFVNMTWSHDRVLADTTARLDGLGVSYSMLPSWFDLDVAEDFQCLQTWLKPESPSALRRTLACLETLGFWPASKV